MILVTGGSGFLGSNLVSELLDKGFEVCATYNRRKNLDDNSFKQFHLNLEEKFDISKTLACVDTVVHCAGLAHETTVSSEHSRYLAVNHQGTIRLLQQCITANVRHFIFLSSVKVIGEKSIKGFPFSDHTSEEPISSYAQSKLLAERDIINIASRHDIRVSTIRPPLIYGKNVGGNFKSLHTLIKTGFPLPFASFDNNLKSLVYVGNLTDFIITLVKSAHIGNSTYLVSDDHDLSTRSIVEHMASALEMRLFLFPAPIWSLRLGLFLVGKSQGLDKMLSTLQVDISKTKNSLNWSPPYGVNDAFKASFLSKND